MLELCQLIWAMGLLFRSGKNQRKNATHTQTDTYALMVCNNVYFNCLFIYYLFHIDSLIFRFFAHLLIDTIDGFYHLPPWKWCCYWDHAFFVEIKVDFCLSVSFVLSLEEARLNKIIVNSNFLQECDFSFKSFFTVRSALLFERQNWFQGICLKVFSLKKMSFQAFMAVPELFNVQ